MATTLDSDRPVPLHRQLKEVLTKEILEGRYKPGDRIPSERALCTAYGVSRSTVRQTVNDLVHEGRLIRTPAKGTFVTPPKIEQDLARVSRFSETIAAVGRTPKVRIVSKQRTVAAEAAQRALELTPGDEVILLDIVGYADADPLVLYHVHLPASLGEPVAASLLRAQDGGRAAFSMILEQLRALHNLNPAWAVQSYEVSLADRPTAEFLGIRPGDPVFVSARTIYTDEGMPVEYDEILYRGDRYRFTIRRAYTLA